MDIKRKSLFVIFDEVVRKNITRGIYLLQALNSPR